jgi:hypothetical protein
MEKVVPLKDEILSGRTGISTAIDVLTAFDPAIKASQTTWTHFDLCPANAAKRANGDIVGIDVESFYIQDAGSFNVTVPAWKRFRAPARMVQEVDVACGSQAGGIPVKMAREKLSFETMLLATECVLGLFAPSGRMGLHSGALRSWAGARLAEPAVSTLVSALELFVEGKQAPSLCDVADALRKTLRPSSSPTTPIASRPTELAQTVPDKLGPVGSVAAGPPTERDLCARELRAGILSGQRMSSYVNSLLETIAKEPSDRGAWDELILIAISFQKDPVRALSLISDALVKFPGDADLERLRRMVITWRGHGENE